MAEITTREIFWRRNSPYGTYVANDIVLINYDTGSGNIVVRKNGSIITSGNSIPLYFNYSGNPATYYKTETEKDVIICDSTNRIALLRNTATFPYATKATYSDSPSCSVSPVVCDLQFNSLPVIVNESSQGAADGEITVSATSSNGSIEYRLNSDFVYGDGNGQASGNFTGLVSGTYRVYARDQGNCSDNIGVIVSYDKVYGVIFQLEYDDIRGGVTQLEIQERDYVGSYTEVCGSSKPVAIKLRGEGEQDKFVTIIGSEIETNLISETNFQFLSLFTSDPNKYRVVFKKNLGSGLETLLTTKLLPNQYKEEYIAAPYNVSFASTDGLQSLSKINFLDGGNNRFTGSYRAIDLIAYCLRNTGLNLNIRVAINLYATGMNTTASDDPLDQAYVDSESYYIDDNPTCLDVIGIILQSFGAQIVQWNNVWNIIRVEERTDAFDYREFDSYGVYSSNGSFDPVLISGNSTQENLIWVANPGLEMNPAYGKINLKYDLGFKENIIKNGDFKLKPTFDFIGGTFFPKPDINNFQLVANGDDGVILTYQIVEQDKVKPYQDSTNVTSDKNNIAIGLSQAFGNAYLVSKSISVKMGYTDQLKFTIKCGLPTFSIELPYVKIRCVVQYGSYYLQGDGSWSATATEIIYFAKEFGKFIEFSTTASYLTGADAGLDLTITVYHAYGFNSEFNSVVNQRAKVTTSLGIGHRTEREDTGNFDLFYYELENNTSAESVPDIVRPNDYHATTNPVQWILKTTRDTGLTIDTVFYIDKIQVGYFFNGSNPPETFDADINGEENNPNNLDLTVSHGSLAEVVQSNINIVPIFQLNPSGFATIQYVDVLVQNAEITYSGYFRDSSGDGFTTWSRDIISESLPLHDILLRSYASQYSAPWRRIRGSLTGQDFVSPISTIFEDSDDRFYYPISLEIDDQQRIFSGEFVEIGAIVGDSGGGGSTGGETDGVGFTTGFTIGFNS